MNACRWRWGWVCLDGYVGEDLGIQSMQAWGTLGVYTRVKCKVAFGEGCGGEGSCVNPGWVCSSRGKCVNMVWNKYATGTWFFF